MKQHLPLDPDVSDLAPSGPALTEYDEEHVITYLRLLDADEDGADWRQVSRIVLHIDAEREPARARRAFDTHFERAKWMSDIGWQQFLERAPSIPSPTTQAALPSAEAAEVAHRVD